MELNHTTQAKVDITSDVRTTRHLKASNLKELYSEEELQDILKGTSGAYESLSDTKYADELSSTKRLAHVWTKAEDDFIRKNYMHLSDNTIGLALNVPGRLVRTRRNALKLSKGQVKELSKVIVWCMRSDFDTVCEEYNLTKLRGA